MHLKEILLLILTCQPETLHLELTEERGCFRIGAENVLQSPSLFSST
jgi:hypothetical protein